MYKAYMLVHELLTTHPTYDCTTHGVSQMQLHADLYEGGAEFERRKNKYLDSRMIEKMDGKPGQVMRATRLQAACYVPHMAGIIDNFTASIMTAAPRIVATGPAEKVEYYNSLNSNVDGTGRDLPALVLSRLLQTMLNFRSYIGIDFPFVEKEKSNLEAQRAAGDLDARLYGLDAGAVDDWEYDVDGELLWVRTHTVEYLRDGAYGPRSIERHHWTYVTDSESVEYIADKKISDSTWAKDATANRLPPVPHSLKALPVVPIEIPRGLWVANRLAPIALSLFNREASEDFALNTSAFAMPVLKKTEPGGDPLVGSELSVVVLNNAADDFFWRTPDAGHYAALAANAATKKANLYSAFGSMILAAAAQDDGGRASGSQLKRKGAPLEVMCRAFAMPVVDALEKCLTSIKAMRGDDDVEIKITGLDKFDTYAIENEIAKVNAFNSIPGMPSKAQSYAAINLFKTVYPDAALDLKDEIANIESAPVSETKSVSTQSITNARTMEPNGMGAQSVSQSYK